jgi:hypothetical protein
MLMRAGNDRPFPQNDLAYLAFRLTACQMLYRIALATEASTTDSLPEGTRGFLEWRVPMLSHVPVTAQVDLLASVWTRHNTARAYWATLLDAAVLYAACHEGALVTLEVLTAARLYLKGSPRQLDIRLDAWTVDRLATMYSRWWPGFDPGLGSALVGLEDYPSRLRRPLEDAERDADLSPGLERRFAGLLTPAEMRRFFPFLY